MKTHQELLTDFSSMGSRHTFALNSGDRCEGWLTEVKDDHTLFVDAATERPGEMKLRFAAIDMSTLAYRDEAKQCWITAHWDEAKDNWRFTEIEQEVEPDEPPPPQPFWKRAFGRNAVEARQ